jgi:hypothetical protein
MSFICQDKSIFLSVSENSAVNKLWFSSITSDNSSVMDCQGLIDPIPFHTGCKPPESVPYWLYPTRTRRLRGRLCNPGRWPGSRRSPGCYFLHFFLVFKLRPYSRRISRSLVKEPKINFYDYCRIQDEALRFNPPSLRDLSHRAGGKVK